MKSLMFLVLIVSGWNAEAKELCTLARTILAPAKNNRCYDQLIAGAKNADDRKWLLSLRDSWKPAANLKLNLIQGGFEMYHGKKKVGQVQWVTMNPPVLYWNGKFLKGKKSPEKSVVKIIQSLFEKPTKTASLYETFLPYASAEETFYGEAKQEEQITMTTLYALGNNPNAVSAADFAAQDEPKEEPMDSLPYLGKKGNIGGKCAAGGVENLTWKYHAGKTDKTAFITQKGPYGFIIRGVAGDDTILVTHNPAGSFKPCISQVSSELDNKHCAPAWDEFLEAKGNEDLAKAWRSENDETVLSCDLFSVDQVDEIVEKTINSKFIDGEQRCRSFFEKKFKTFSAEDQVGIKMCRDKNCSQTVELAQWQFEEYKKALADAGIKADADCIPVIGCSPPKDYGNLAPRKIQDLRQLAKKTAERDPEAEAFVEELSSSTTRAHLQRFVEGASLLSEVCKDPKLRDLIDSKHDILLSPPSATGTQGP